MRDPERHGPAVDTAKVRGKRFRGYVARLLADMAGRLESSYADLKKTVEEALEHQAATSEVLRVISSSPAELEPVFQAMLANATARCASRPAAGDVCRAAAQRAAPARPDDQLRPCRRDPAAR